MIKVDLLGSGLVGGLIAVFLRCWRSSWAKLMPLVAWEM